MRDPHLQQVRTAHALRTRGMSAKQIADVLGVSAPTASKRLAEYDERRKAGTLFTDIDRVVEADLYNHASIMARSSKTAHTGRD